MRTAARFCGAAVGVNALARRPHGRYLETDILPSPSNVMPNIKSMLPVAALALSIAACHQRATTPAPQALASTLPAGVTQQLIARGDSMFRAPNASCHRCHMPDAAGGPNAPSLRSGPWLHGDGSFEQITTTIVEGVSRAKLKDASRRFEMNPRGGPMNLSDDQAKALAAWVWSISRAKTRG